MKSFLLLLFQLTFSVMLLGVAPSFFGILQENPQSWVNLYQQTAELFAIPFCLLIFGFSKKLLFLALRLGWGLWTAIISTCLLWKAPIHFPEITEFGQILISFNAVFGFSLALFSLIELSKLFPVEGTSFLSSASPEAQPTDSPMDLVEGA